MILIDFNQVIFAGVMPHLTDKRNTLDESILRHLVLNIIRGHIKKFGRSFNKSDVVIACDSRKYWRKEVFPFYKAGRKAQREKSDLDWQLFFDLLSKFKQELKDNFPYRVIDIEGAEADDIIGTLTPRFAANDKVLIISSDGDFLQLQQYGENVFQYDPSSKKFLKSKNPKIDLKEKIIRGDRGDGIPNILSASDCFVTGKRQSRMTDERMNKYMSTDPDKWSDSYAETNFHRNSTLIDLTFIPVALKEKIINNYEELKIGRPGKLLDYFIDKRLKNLMEVIEDF